MSIQIETSFEVGKKYIIRTVTHMNVGRLVDITKTDMVLEQAAWIADSGPWARCLGKGEVAEAEPFPDKVIIARDAVIDAAEWNHDLIREVVGDDDKDEDEDDED